jgi:putative two-component system response regulator
MTGRIVALADVYDALTTARPYKEAIDSREGLKIIQDSSGILFDPRLVDIFTKKINDILRIK